MAILRKIKTGLYHLAEQETFFWFSLIFLNILLFLPRTLLSPGPVEFFPLPPLDTSRGWYDTILFFFRRTNQDFFRLVADYYLILTLLFISTRLKWYTITRTILVSSYMLLLLYQIYDHTLVLIFGESPILYNDFMLLKGAVYLIIDIAFTRKFLAILAVIMSIILVLLAIPILFKAVTGRLEKTKLSRGLIIGGLLVWILIIFNIFWFRFHDYRPVTQWITPKIITNLKKSITLRQYLKTARDVPMDSTYYHYQKLDLFNRPDIYLLMIESYGRVLVDHPEIRESYLNFLQQMADTLQNAGWSMTSHFSQAPIFGGRSWLSMGSLICGTSIKHEAVYSFFINRVKEYPHLVHFLNQQGYHTIALQPLNRARPGFSMENYENFYSYKQYINFEDLDFDGPSFGFRNIPDQYSLNYAFDKYIQQAPSPKFLFFLTVSSHSPWVDLPPYLTDWRAIRQASKMHAEDKYGVSGGKLSETMQYHFSQGIGYADYAAHIFYELAFIRDFILTLVPQNCVIILVGDHQPPIITQENPDFATPLHIISPDKNFLNFFREIGFVPGLILPPHTGEPLHHEGIYSLLVSALAHAYSRSDSLPVPLPRGIPLSFGAFKK